MSLEKLSFVLLTYEREPYLRRSLTYWSQYPITIYVLDGSEMPAKNIHYPHVHYFHHPVSFQERIKLSLQLPITTPYTAFIADDEYAIPSALIKNIQFLEKNPEFISAMGRCWAMSYRNKNVYTWDLYPEHKGYAVNQDNAIERLVYHFSPYVHSTLYAVTRTPSWKQCFLAYSKKEFPVYAMGEIQFELSNAYLGKSIVLDELMWFKSDEVASASTVKAKRSNPSLDKKNSLTDWWLDKENNHAEFLSIMAESLEKEKEKHPFLKEQLSKLLDQCPYQSEKPTVLRRILLNFTKKVPYSFKQTIKTILLSLINLFLEKNVLFDKHVDMPIEKALKNQLRHEKELPLHEINDIVLSIKKFYRDA